MSSFHSRTWLQATLALSLVSSSLKSVCCDFSIFSAVMPRLPALFLSCYMELCRTLTIFCNQRPKVWGCIHLLGLDDLPTPVDDPPTPASKVDSSFVLFEQHISYHCILFYYSTEITSSIPSLFLSTLYLKLYLLF